MKAETPNKYCFDSSALIWINRYYPYKLIPDLWKHMDDLFNEKRIISHDLVYDEIVPDTGAKDEIAKLIEKYKSSFLPISKVQINLVSEILAKFPKLIDPTLKKDQADPWLIALVREKMEEENLFGDDSEYVVISTEGAASPTKIPAVCKYFNVRHMHLFDFFEDNAWEFSMKPRKD